MPTKKRSDPQAVEPAKRRIDFDAIKPVSRASRLLDVAVMTFGASATGPLVGRDVGALRQRMEFRANRQPTEGSVVISFVDFRFKVTDKEDADLCSVEGAMLVAYALDVPEGTTLPEQAITDFAEVNAMYHAWPYLRELVGSCTNRLGLGGVILPIWTPPVEFPPVGEYVVLTSEPVR